MKKFCTVVLIAALVLSLAACSGTEKLPAGIDLDKAASAVEALEIFPMGGAPDEAMLGEIMGVDPSLIQESRIYIPMMNVHASTYWIILAKDGQQETLKGQIDAYMGVQEEMWSQYLPDQYDLLVNREYKEIATQKGTYLVYVASQDNGAVMAAIEDALQQ